ncbi:polyprenyl synthetase family protein [Streptomyces sp. NPDC001851]|uniref:polyprenyl synthetase family protein n=1 Tax=Streptomyces sp. NPDC001851 TaxID=3154529 RepID=UPI003334613D
MTTTSRTAAPPSGTGRPGAARAGAAWDGTEPSGRTPDEAAQARLREGRRLLGRARALVGPELRDAVDRLAEPIRSVAGYHFGWSDEAGRPANTGWGKGVRAALVLSSAQALGAPRGDAVAAATAVELVHNFSLVHDDLMDGDATRRGSRTVWSAFGSSQAVLTGDALLALALDVITRGGGGTSAATVRELCEALLELVAGQAADIAFEARQDVGLDECVAMANGKTAGLLARACALGALVADVEPERVDAMRAFGRHLGITFQLVDDLLGIWGDSAVTGKPVGSDLRSRKKSLPVVAALSGGTEAGARLAGLYHRPEPLTDDEVAEAAWLIEEAGGRRWAEREAARRREAALDCLGVAGPDPDGARALTLIADLVTRRDS